MRTRTTLVILLLLLLQGTAATAGTGASGDLHPGNTILMVDSPGEAVAAVSTGADLAYGNQPLKEEVVKGREVYELGKDETSYPEVGKGDIPERMNVSFTGPCPRNRRKRVYAAMIASFNSSRVVCVDGEEPVEKSLEELKERYIREIKETGDGINHLQVASLRMAPVASAIAADQHAFLQLLSLPGGKAGVRKLEVSEGIDWRRNGRLFNTTARGGELSLQEATVVEGFEDSSPGSKPSGWSVEDSADFGVTRNGTVPGSTRALNNHRDAFDCCSSAGRTMKFEAGTPEVIEFWIAEDRQGLKKANASKYHVLNRAGNKVMGTRIGNNHIFARRSPITEDVKAGKWYRIRYYGIDEGSDTFSAEAFGVEGERLGGATDLKAGGEISFQGFRFDNSHGSVNRRVDEWLDEISYGKDRSKGNWTGEIQGAFPREREVKWIQVDISTPDGGAVWVTFESMNAENVTTHTEVFGPLKGEGKRNLTGISRIEGFRSYRISLNMTGRATEVRSLRLFHESSEGSEEVNRSIQEAIGFLEERGLYTGGREKYREGLFVSLLGVPPVVKEDPVEEADWSLSDPKDGKRFATDLPYGDFNRDGRLDAAVGRYPADRSLASRMYLRSKYYEGKKALVASEYLHQNWPVILAYLGGGMFSGKSIERVLERQGYEVSRAVEYRANPEQFLIDLTPVKLKGVISDSNRIGEKIGSVLGTSVGTAASQVYLAVKAINYVERGLEQYLEFDWSTAGLDIERAKRRLSEKDVSGFKGAAKDVAEEVSSEGIKQGLVDSLKTEGVQAAIAKALYSFFWPDRYGRLTEERLRNEIPEKEVVYYTGVGNGSAWVLPNKYSKVLGVVNSDGYNGSDALSAEELPPASAEIVFDNSDLAGARSAEMRRDFLQKGAATYIGTSSVNYAPFSSEIDTRFFKKGYTTGQSLKKAVNEFADDRLTWSPFNTVARDGVEEKMLRSFRLYGNPEMPKDPEIETPDFNRSKECSRGRCVLELESGVNYTVIERGGDRVLEVSSDDYLLRSFRPMIPLLEFEHAIPRKAKITSTDIRTETRKLKNVSVPAVTPVSHGGRVLGREVRGGWFPPRSPRVITRGTLEGRKRISLTYPGLRYSPGNRTAEVVEEIQVRLEYTTPYALEVEAENSVSRKTNISLTVWNSENSTEAGLLLKLKGRKGMVEKSLDLELDPGKNRFSIPIQVDGTGRFAVETYLFVEGTVVGPRRDNFVAGTTGLELSIPEIVEEGERFEAVATVKNRRDEPREIPLHINGSRGLQTVFLQESSRKLRVPGRGSRMWRVPLRSFRTGNITVELSSGSSTVSRMIEVERSPEKGFAIEPSGSPKTVEIRNSRGWIRTELAGSPETWLKTGRYTVEERKLPGKTVLVVRGRDGNLKATVEEGEVKVRRKNGITITEALRFYRVLRREKRKLVERYRLSEIGSR
ncbi:MAG: C25 family cysteine peptidase [Candidatus Nanohaloarchaea archaeon]|nr:C25 family cysteine peptidase [Candidatus Nanohaloarchaea archaeon]